MIDPVAAAQTLWMVIVAVFRASVRSVKKRESFITSLRVEWVKEEKKAQDELDELREQVKKKKVL